MADAILNEIKFINNDIRILMNFWKMTVEYKRTILTDLKNQYLVRVYSVAIKITDMKYHSLLEVGSYIKTK